tara:strand:+ start:28 stop:423 length:396 start_codon:yes stop_codon:yes gene_type:complete
VYYHEGENYMNVGRRNDINQIHGCLGALAGLASGICECISKARDDEQDEFESMPDEFAQESDSADAIYALDKGIEIFVDLDFQLTEVVQYPETAAPCGDDQGEPLPVTFSHGPFHSLIEAVAQSRNLMTSS